MIEDSKLISLELSKTICMAIVNLPPASVSKQLNGCARVYVTVGYKKMMKSHIIVKELTKIGMRMFTRPGYKGVTIYMGYDNATGNETAKAEQVAKVFKDNGVKAYVDHDGD